MAEKKRRAEGRKRESEIKFKEWVVRKDMKRVELKREIEQKHMEKEAKRNREEKVSAGQKKVVEEEVEKWMKRKDKLFREERERRTEVQRLEQEKKQARQAKADGVYLEWLDLKYKQGNVARKAAVKRRKQEREREEEEKKIERWETTQLREGDNSLDCASLVLTPASFRSSQGAQMEQEGRR